MQSDIDEVTISNVRKLNEQLSQIIDKISCFRYNCYGFVARTLNWIDEMRWLDEDEMEQLLEERTYGVTKDEAKLGDIAVYRDVRSTLQHTSIIICDDIIIHKPGNFELEMSKLDGSEGISYKGIAEITEYRRPY